MARACRGSARSICPCQAGHWQPILPLRGHPVYVMDARGYDRSPRPVEMDAPASAAAPLVRAWAVMRDIDAVVREITGRDDRASIGLLGRASWCCARNAISGAGRKTPKPWRGISAAPPPSRSRPSRTRRTMCTSIAEGGRNLFLRTVTTFLSGGC